MKMIMYPCTEGWDSQKYWDGHRGLDFGWIKGYSSDGRTPIVACDDGTVEFEGFYKQTFGGKTYNPIGVIIRHTDWSDEFDYFSIYWHLSRTFVDIGQKIKRGDEIGIKGDSGCSQGVHLHFQVIKVNKGASLPDQHTKDNWSAISVNPTEWIEVYDGQTFKCTGNFDLKHHINKSNEEYESEINRLATELADAKKENSQLKASIDSFVEEVMKIYE